MCGLVGVIAAKTINTDLSKVFSHMLDVDVTRGYDATGIIYVESDGGFEVEKGAVLPPNLRALSNKWSSHKNITNASKYKALLGHNRAATVGELKDENSHPFTFKNVVGSCNGTLDFWKDLDPEGEYEVDSQALYSKISEVGLEEAWKYSGRGGTALNFYEPDKKNISFIRNEDRPLLFAWTKEGDLIFASEKWMITSACERHGVKLKDKKVYQANTDVEYSISIKDKDKISLSRNVLPKPKKTVSRFVGYGGYGGSRVFRYVSPKQPAVKKESTKSWTNNRDVKQDKGWVGVEFLFAGVTTLKEFSFKMKDPSDHEDGTSYTKLYAHPVLDKEKERLESLEVGDVVTLLHRPRGCVSKSQFLHVQSDGIKIANETSGKNKKKESEGEDKKTEVITEDGLTWVITTFGDRYLKDEYLEIISLGDTGSCCAWCGSPLDLDKLEDTVMEPDGTVFDAECYEEYYSYLKGN